MKKSFLLLALMSAFAGTASAQSSVTIYGLFDIGLTSTRSDTSSNRIGLDSGNWYGSKLGFKGTEDLGDGLSAEFRLENGFNGDTGTAAQGGRIFGRQAYVGLTGGFGAVKLGRQWTPAYLALGNIDPFEAGLAGDASAFLGSNIFYDIDVRMSNAITYSKSLNGVSVTLAYGLGEAAGNAAANRQLGFTAAFEKGPINVSLAYHNVNDATGNGSAKATIVGGTCNFGPATLHAAYDVDKTDASGVTIYDKKNALIGLSVPLGAGKILLSYIRQDDRSAANIDSSQYALGYTHALSKRTTLYTSYGYVNTNSATTVNAGIRHTF